MRQHQHLSNHERKAYQGLSNLEAAAGKGIANATGDSIKISKNLQGNLVIAVGRSTYVIPAEG